MLVSGIPDENTCQHLPNLLPGGMRVLIQQPCQHQRCRRCIVRTLYNTGGYHSLLHIVQFSPLHQGLRRANLRPFSLIQQDKVCIAQLAVKNNGIRPGKALGVIAVANGVISFVIQRIPQAHSLLAMQGNGPSVDVAFDFHAVTSPPA